MSDTLAGVRKLVKRDEIRVSRHGFRELAADEILLHVVAAGIETAIAIEDYPDATRGPSVLVLQHDETAALFTWFGGFSKALPGQQY